MPAGAVYLTVERSETDFSLSEHILHSFSIIIFSIVIKGSVMSTRYAVLCGSAPEDFRQKKQVEMHDFLVSAEGGSWQEDEILEFPNGVHELMLEYALGGVIRSGMDEVLLYICTETPVAVRKSVRMCWPVMPRTRWALIFRWFMIRAGNVCMRKSLDMKNISMATSMLKNNKNNQQNSENLVDTS